MDFERPEEKKIELKGETAAERQEAIAEAVEIFLGDKMEEEDMEAKRLSPEYRILWEALEKRRKRFFEEAGINV